MIEISPADHASELLTRLRSTRVTYFPIRHHSPACAAHIERWILENRPVAVLVEGPSSFTPRIEQLTDQACHCPVALYTNFVDKKGRLKALKYADKEGEPDAPDSAFDPLSGLDLGPPRFAAYYPFCDYSPELVALRTGRDVGARLRFIDLEYGEMILAQFQASKDKQCETVRVESLAEDSHLAHSRYVKAVAQELGCRDFDELWDHLFETGWENLSTDLFMDRLAVYCAMARLDYSAEDLAADATTAREACMAAAIVEELAHDDGKILVVTGGFHTVALPGLVAAKTKRPAKITFADEEAGVWLMRYSFDRLDSLAGYSAGMPSPAFYDKLWQARKGSSAGSAGSWEEQCEHVAAEILVEISRLTRARKLANLITTPDAIAAVQMAKQLAALREHPYPMREDIMDGIRSCFVKGEINIEGQFLLRLVKEVLAGTRVGDIPPGGDLPPIVDDFYRESRKFRLPIEQVEKKEISLELYRNANHRGISRFFHRLGLLQSPFARYLGGPDFVTGQRLDLMQERWEASWSPLVESTLIEASLYGTTIEEAAATRLKMQIARLEEDAQGRSGAVAVELLIRACRLGLHAQSAAMVPLIDQHIAEDPSIKSVVIGLSQLELLQQAREPLEAFHLSAVPDLMLAAYHRACRLLPDLAHCPDGVVEEALPALQTLREILASSSSAENPDDGNANELTGDGNVNELTGDGNANELTGDSRSAQLDADLFFAGLQTIINSPPDKAQSAVVGAAAGILYAEARLSTDELIKVVCGYLGGAINDPRKSVGILRGLLASSCEIAWQVGEVLTALDLQFRSWDEKTFLDLLPELRLAFSGLTPRDIARVAEKVSCLHKGQTLGELVHTDLDESEIQFGLILSKRVRDSLRTDGLAQL